MVSDDFVCVCGHWRNQHVYQDGPCVNQNCGCMYAVEGYLQKEEEQPVESEMGRAIERWKKFFGGIDQNTLVQGYCLKCKLKVSMTGPTAITMKNGKPAIVGSCPTCLTKIYKIGNV